MNADLTAPRVDAEAVKRANPIEEVIARYGIALQRSGRALVGRCPFHDDQGRPNLHVYQSTDPARDGWFCFRCWVGGDQISFVMRQDRLGFADACARLGSRAPLAACRTRPRRLAEQEARRRWEALTGEEQAVMDAALAVYQDALRREPRALAYLRARGIPEWVVRACRLGYADGRSLEAFLRPRAWLPVAERLGLLTRPSDGRAGPLRELLRGRVVVPELRGGHCVWLIGRRLPTRGVPRRDRLKYLALPGERPLLGLERVVGRSRAFVVEGVFGWLVALSWRLPACSPCGTHLPPDRLACLSHADTVYGVLDPDPAGRAGAERLAVHLGPRWRPLWLPRELDDLALRPDGQRTFFRLLAGTRHAARTEEPRAHH